MMIEAVNQAAIILVAKMPIPGRVKTRLSPSLSDMDTAELYTRFLRDSTGKVSAVCGATPFIALNISDDPGAFDALRDTLELPHSITVLDQGVGNLGERLVRLCRYGLTAAGRLVLIGSDSPTLPLSYIERALDALEAYDVVIGPSDDGGYYLIGVSGNHRCLFEEIDWSTGKVFEQTLARAAAANLSVEVLDNWYDVDDISGLRRLRDELLGNPSSAPHTARHLMDLRW